MSYLLVTTLACLGFGSIFLALSLVNQPDLRSWMSLPAEFQLVRYRVPSGVHRLTVIAGGGAREVQVDVRPRRVTLVVLRSY